MKPSDLKRAADPASYADGLTPPDDGEDHGHVHASVRTDGYEGHTITVETTYRIAVDGQPVTAHIHVDNDGNVICHATPVYRSGSVVDLVRHLIDVFPEDFPKPRPGDKPTVPSGSPDGGHMHGHGH